MAGRASDAAALLVRPGSSSGLALISLSEVPPLERFSRENPVDQGKDKVIQGKFNLSRFFKKSARLRRANLI